MKPEPIRYYRSQYREDRWIAKHWRKIGLPSVGFFVEFGSGDGLWLSNTYWLEYLKGWRGMMVEADPRNTVNRPGCIVERAFVGPPGVVSFGLHPTDGQLSGARRMTPERIDIPSVPLSTLLEKHKIDRVDLISIDTEGTELEAWETLDLSRWCPTIAIVELYTLDLPDQSQAVIDRMAADGYKMIHRTAGNGIFQCAASS